MKILKIRDNELRAKSDFSELKNLTCKIADKTLGQLEKEGIFVFPEELKDIEDIEKDQMILQSVNESYRAGNVMGFLGCGDERIIISSRFSAGGEDFLFQYLLNRVIDFPSIVELDSDADYSNRLFHFLIFLFGTYLKEAVRKGIYKKYIRAQYNNEDVKGCIDIVRHIRKNTPFTGKIAYTQREFSYDNHLMELVRHTIEFIKRKPYGYRILEKVRDEVKLVKEATPRYKQSDLVKVVDENERHAVRHAYFREYRALQRLCLLILQQQKHHIGTGSRHIYGVIFDGAWLWEEYINSIIGDIFYHPRNKGGSGAQKLFGNNTGLIYPDFISRDTEPRIIADAKYKYIDNIGNKDYLQLLAYMFRFDAKSGYYLYPEAEGKTDSVLWLNSGSTYEANVSKRADICVTKHGLKIPTNVKNYEDFETQIKINESLFRDLLVAESTPKATV